MLRLSGQIYAFSTAAYLLSTSACSSAWATTVCNITFTGQTSCGGSTTNGTTGCLTLGSSLPDSITGSATGLNGPMSSSAITNTIAIETAILDANLAFGSDSTANCTITLPSSGFYYLHSYCSSSQSAVCSTGPSVTLNSGSTTLSATLPVEHNAILDVSSYSSTSLPVPLGNLTATSTGHLTIGGSSGTTLPTLYTDNDLTAIIGQHTNHVTFKNIELNRPIYEETEGTITAISSRRTTFTTLGGATLTVLPYVTIDTPAGFRFADMTWADDENYIKNKLSGHVARYMRKYDSTSLTLASDVSGTLTNANVQEAWGEAPDSYSSSSGSCAMIAGSQWDATSGVCEVPPSAAPGDPAGTLTCTSTSCNVYLKDTQAPTYWAVGDFVCLKSKMSGPYTTEGMSLGSPVGYKFVGPWDVVTGTDPGTPVNYGGFDVTFQNVTWVQQAYGSAILGFRAFNVINSTIMRAPPPQSGSPSQCLADGNGGPQLGSGSAGDPESLYTNTLSSAWPPNVVASATGSMISTISTISGLTATATGDDTIALFDQSSLSVTLSNNVINDGFARGIFVNNDTIADDPVICSDGSSWNGTVCQVGGVPSGGIPVGTTITSATLSSIGADAVVTSTSNTLTRDMFGLGGGFAPNGVCIGPTDYCPN